MNETYSGESESGAKHTEIETEKQRGGETERERDRQRNREGDMERNGERQRWKQRA